MAADAAKVRKTKAGGRSGTKMDSGKDLSKGPQRVDGPETVTYYSEYIRSSPASGFPYHQDVFTQGHRWTEAPGKVDPSSGNGAV